MVDISRYNSSAMVECEFKLIRYETTSPSVQVFLVILYGCTSFAAFAGNIAVIFVEIFGKKTNSNLRKYLINLAIADILAGVFCVPFSFTQYVFNRWIFEPFLCPLMQFIQYLSVFVTASTLSLIGIERYMAVLHPITNYTIIYRRNTIILIIIWILGSLYAYCGCRNAGVYPFKLPPLEKAIDSIDETETKAQINAFNNETIIWHKCAAMMGKNWISKSYIIFNYMSTFVIPLIIIGGSYFCIMRKLINNDSIEFNNTPLRRSGQPNDSSKIIKMMAMIVLLFAGCWTPIKTRQLLSIFRSDLFKVCSWFDYYWGVSSFLICHWLAMAHSFVNPIVYSFMSKSFRADLYDLTRIVSNKIGSSMIGIITISDRNESTQPIELK